MTEDIFEGLDSTCKCLENRLNKAFPQLPQTKRKQDIEHMIVLLSGRSEVRILLGTYSNYGMIWISIRVIPFFVFLKFTIRKEKLC